MMASGIASPGIGARVPSRGVASVSAARAAIDDSQTQRVACQCVGRSGANRHAEGRDPAALRQGDFRPAGRTLRHSLHEQVGRRERCPHARQPDGEHRTALPFTDDRTDQLEPRRR